MFHCSICDESFDVFCLWQRHIQLRRHTNKLSITKNIYPRNHIRNYQKLNKQDIIKNNEINDTIKEENKNKKKEKIIMKIQETKIKLKKLQKQLDELDEL